MSRILSRHPFWMYLLIFFFSQLIASVPTVLTLVLRRGEAPSSELMIAATLFAANLLAIHLFLLYRPKDVNWPRTMAGIQGQNGQRTLLVCLLALPLIMLIHLMQEAFFPDIPDLVGEETFKTIMFHPLGMLTVCFLGPLSEELLFRGGVQTDLTLHHSDQGWAIPILISAVLFTIIHLNPAQMPAAFILGCLLGYAYWWTGSLIAPVCIHVFNNSLACLLTYLSPDEDNLIQFLGGPTSAGITALVSIFFFVIILRVIIQLTKQQP